MTAEVAHISDTGRLRPVLFEDAGRVLVELDLSDALMTGSFESKINASDAGEQADEPELLHYASPWAGMVGMVGIIHGFHPGTHALHGGAKFVPATCGQYTVTLPPLARHD